VERRRQFELLGQSGGALSLDARAELANPFLDPGFIAALAARGPGSRRAGRTTLLAAVLDGLLPNAVLARDDKADFTRVLWGDEARQFAAAWNGEGPPGELVDAPRLRQVWAAERPDFRSATALQAAWLAEAPGGTLSVVGEGLGAPLGQWNEQQD
jgi:hypothetical protein